MSRDVMEREPVPATHRHVYGADPNQFYDVYLPPSSRDGASDIKGLAIMIHGGFWRAKFDLQPASHICAALAKEGLICASLEYRRGAQQGGGWPKTFEDVGIGFTAVRERFRAYGNPIVLGHSAGGHLALLLAANTRDIRGVVALGAVSCLVIAQRLQLGSGAVEEFMEGTPEDSAEFYAAADPVQHRSSVRRMLVHGTLDDIVPFSVASSFFDARQGDAGAVTLVEIPDGDHFDPIDPESKGWPIVMGCVETLLA